MKKIVIIGGGLSGLLIANFLSLRNVKVYLLEKHDLNIDNSKNYYKFKKKNLHAHVFTSFFCYTLKKYFPKIYYLIQNKNKNKNIFFEKIFVNEINLSKVELNKILLENIYDKIKIFNNINKIEMEINGDLISEIRYETKNQKDKIDKVDLILDCSGSNSYFKKELVNKNNLDIVNIPKNRFLLSYFFNINDKDSLTNLNNLLLEKNITIYKDKFNLSIKKNNKQFSATFVSSHKEFLDKNYVREILIDYLKEKNIQNINFNYELKWSHLNSSFIKYKSSSNCIKNLIPIGESFMKTNPELGQGSTLSLLQSIYVYKKISNDFEIDNYIKLFLGLFKEIELNKSKKIKLGSNNFLKNILPYYMKLRSIYSYYTEKNKYNNFFNKLN